MPHVEVLVGSPSDLHFVWESDLLDRLEQEGIRYSVSACSAHRNTVQLAQRIDQVMDDTAVFVCCAGWAAALPGAVKALLLGKSLATVFGIALPSEEYPDAHDAETSIKRLPPGVDVVYGGVGSEGLNSITEEVISLTRSYQLVPDQEELQKVRDKIKQPQFNIPRPTKED